MTKKLEWTVDLLDELSVQRKREGRSLKDLVNFVFAKTGVKITPARVSQVLTKYNKQWEVPVNAD